MIGGMLYGGPFGMVKGFGSWIVGKIINKDKIAAKPPKILQNTKKNSDIISSIKNNDNQLIKSRTLSNSERTLPEQFVIPLYQLSIQVPLPLLSNGKNFKKDRGTLLHNSSFCLSPELSETTNSDCVFSQNPIAEEILLLDSSRFLLLGIQILSEYLSCITTVS